MKVGRYQVAPIVHQTFGLDGGAMFGIVPKPLWEKKISADERNRILLATRSLFIESENRKILVDTGMGDKWEAKQRDIYKIDAEKSALYKFLHARDLSVSDITDVILTHLHFDHTGGSTVREDGEVIPAFPNATYYVQKRQWEWARNPTEKDGGSFIGENFQPLMEHGVVELLDGETELFPGLEIKTRDGHTTGQQLPFIRDDKQPLLYCADLIPTSAHISLPWVMGYDNHPLTTIEEKKATLDQAAEANWILVFEHDPDTSAVTVNRSEDGVEIGDRVALI